jgi:6-phosphogluconolactonase (cycloisomerase 2 family)
MKGFNRTLLWLVLAAVCASPGYGENRVQAKRPLAPSDAIYVAGNQDLVFPVENNINFYLAQGTDLTFFTNALTGGFGIQGGFFGSARLNTIPSVTAPCLYASNGGDNTIGSISLPDLQLIDVFKGSDSDDGSENGIGLASNANYLYASYSNSGTIATFTLQPGCGLSFLGDIPATGLQGGTPSGMAVNGSILVVAYGDGSIESFNIAGGIPVSNGDKKNSNGYGGGAIIAPAGNLPSGVDITRDGKFAIFGDISTATMVEIASLASGKLSNTRAYTLGTAVSSGTVRLSPDQTMLYIANSEGGTVTAAFFDANTGRVTPGCTSPTLKEFNARPWLGAVATRDTTGTGNVVYVTEYGRVHTDGNNGQDSAIGILSVTSNGTSCTLTESAGSPVSLAYPGALSIAVYPPRPF